MHLPGKLLELWMVSKVDAGRNPALPVGVMTAACGKRLEDAEFQAQRGHGIEAGPMVTEGSLDQLSAQFVRTFEHVSPVLWR